MASEMRILAVILLLLLPTSLTCQAQNAAKQLLTATNDLDRQLSAIKPNDELNQQCSNDIASARSGLKLGYLYLALYKIRSCQQELSTLSYVTSKFDAAKKSPEAFEEEWQRLGAEFNEKEHKNTNANSGQLPAVVVALADAAQLQAKLDYQTAHSLAARGNVSGGFYSLGRASANLNFASFCRKLGFPPPKSTVSFRSVATELNKLGTAALRTYKSADFSKQQDQSNRLKDSITLAGELNAASKFEGALFEYLESELYFGLILTTAEREDLQHLQERSRELGKLLTTRKKDHSIGLLFSQMAEMALNSTDSGEPTPTQIKTAVVILNNVVPSYLDYMKGIQQ